MGRIDFGDIVTRVRLWVPLAWIGTMLFLLWDRWGAIRSFTLSDTDDNMRIMQVRGLLSGQGWFDLRQYRLDPPAGADMHWSRLVDLPIAAIDSILQPMIGGAAAERWAAALAPMLPMGVAMLAIALVVRRMVAPKAMLLGLLFLAAAHTTRGMWVPMRVDHHGWQLAFLALIMAGLTDPERRRGGVVIGLASAASLVIGLEMLIYLAIAGAVVGILWIRDGDGGRLAGYGAALGGGCAAGFLIFASHANGAPVCDALSPVWLSVMVLAGALCLLLALLRPGAWPARLALAGLAAIILVGVFMLLWPDCWSRALGGRLEGVSERAQQLWLDRVREARPIYTQSATSIVTFVTLPITGLVGYSAMLWTSRRDPERCAAWAGLAALAAASAALLLWQTRAGPAANLLAIPGAAGLSWVLLFAVYRSRHAAVRVLGTALGFLIVSGIGPQLATQRLAAERDTSPRSRQVNRSNALCPSMAALRPIALQPKGEVLTFVDLSPRLITVTHHDAVAGPYHRNDEAIVDVMESFMGTPDRAHQTVKRRGIDYVLICPMMSESTNYQVRAPNGFYAQLAKGQAPGWLSPVTLPANSPFRMWRVVG